MTYTQALASIKKNWSTLEHEIRDGHEAVWIARSDTAGPYEVDEEWIGMKGDGSLLWAYASGCSCWMGDYSTAPLPTIKTFAFEHKHTSDDWKAAIIEFAKTKTLQDL